MEVLLYITSLVVGYYSWPSNVNSKPWAPAKFAHTLASRAEFITPGVFFFRRIICRTFRHLEILMAVSINVQLMKRPRFFSNTVVSSASKIITTVVNIVPMIWTWMIKCAAMCETRTALLYEKNSAHPHFLTVRHINPPSIPRRWNKLLTLLFNLFHDNIFHLMCHVPSIQLNFI